MMQAIPAAPHFIVPTASGVCAPCGVRRRAICDALDEGEVAALEAIMTATRLDANEPLVYEGDPRLRVYTLTSGMLRLSKLLPDGRRQIAGFLMPGDYLGVADDLVYDQTAEAVMASTLCGFSASRMEALMQRFPRLKDRLYAMTRDALRQARLSQILLGRLAPVEKVASFVLMTANRAAHTGSMVDVVELPMTRADIADFLGLTIETVSRSFTKLKLLHLIRLLNPHHVEITDKRGLEAAAGWGHSGQPSSRPQSASRPE